MFVRLKRSAYENLMQVPTCTTGPMRLKEVMQVLHAWPSPLLSLGIAVLLDADNPCKDPENLKGWSVLRVVEFRMLAEEQTPAGLIASCNNSNLLLSALSYSYTTTQLIKKKKEQGDWIEWLLGARMACFAYPSILCSYFGGWWHMSLSP